MQPWKLLCDGSIERGKSEVRGQKSEVGSFLTTFFKSRLAEEVNPFIFAPHQTNGPVAQLNRAFDYGSKGFRFES